MDMNDYKIILERFVYTTLINIILFLWHRILILYIMKNFILPLFFSFVSIQTVCCTSTTSSPKEEDNSSSPIQITPPIMGWSSWNTYRININEELIKRQADAMIDQGLKDAGYNYINIDDGFFGGRDKDGNLLIHPQRFPNGLKTVAEYIHSKGLKAGIYSDAGYNTCGSYFDNDPNGIGVGLYGHEKQDAHLFFNQCGFDFIKIDYCGADKFEEKERYTEIATAIQQTCNKEVSINICRWAFPGVWGSEIARSWRISPDIAPNWESIKSIINKNLYLSAYAKNGHYNDMDMLEIGRGLKPEEEEVHFGIWCIMSSPLLIGCDLTTIPESSLKLLKNKELINLNQDPLGLQAYVIQHKNEGYIFVKDIKEKRGKERAVAFYNPSDTECTLSIPLSELELEGKTYVRDLIKQQDEINTNQNLTYTIPARSVKILQLKSEKRLEPVLYEAEWAYLPCFNDLGKSSQTPYYQENKDASGKTVVHNLGGNSSNYAEWNEVYSTNGGNYKMSLVYFPTNETTNTSIELNINGVSKPVNIDINKNSLSIPITLKQGYNTIRIGSSKAQIVDIDYFTIKKE